jgi:3-oxoacyl-[acyl-carrier-protein] synthase-3
MAIKAAIRAIASYLPETVLSNEDLAATFPEWDASKILEKTGIAVRRIAAADECASDLAVRAADRLFEIGACSREEIDFLIVCTQSPDYFLPTTACLVQERLKLETSCGAIDINQGCSGFVYGLSVAKGLIESGAATNVLLITAETYSKFINDRDRSVRTIFGDAAAATLVSGVESAEDLIGPFVFGTDGRGAPNLIVPVGGTRRPKGNVAAEEREAESGNWRSDENLYMNGPEIFNFTLKAVPESVNSLLAKSGKAIQDVDYFVFHQANRFMLDRLRAKMKLPEEKFCVELENCGNTVSSTIPIALERAMERGVVREGARVMLVGFGVGYSWAATMVGIQERSRG